uniref:Uncharacterized protein n=1 Tax=Arundo donax TaxID=35708 RepID=A0A0A9FAK4_ARUDO
MRSTAAGTCHCLGSPSLPELTVAAALAVHHRFAPPSAPLAPPARHTGPRTLLPLRPARAQLRQGRPRRDPFRGRRSASTPCCASASVTWRWMTRRVGAGFCARGGFWWSSLAAQCSAVEDEEQREELLMLGLGGERREIGGWI